MGFLPKGGALGKLVANPVRTAAGVATFGVSELAGGKLGGKQAGAIGNKVENSLQALADKVTGAKNPLSYTPEAAQATGQEELLRALNAAGAGPYQATAQSVTAPQAQAAAALLGDPRFAGVSAFVSPQQQLAAQLLAQSQGQGPASPAELMLRAEQDRQLNQQMALAASMSGRSLPAAQRQILSGNALGQQEAARQAAILRLQEGQKAQELLGTVTAAGRAGDATLRGQDIQLGQGDQAEANKIAMANADAKLRADLGNASNDLQRQQITAQAAQARSELLAKIERDKLDAAMAAAAANNAAKQNQIAQGAQIVGGITSGAASAATKAAMG